MSEVSLYISYERGTPVHLSSKVNLPHEINLRAWCSATLVTQRSDIRNPRTPPCELIVCFLGVQQEAAARKHIEEGEARKAEGNAALKAGDLPLAVRKYPFNPPDQILVFDILGLHCRSAESRELWYKSKNAEKRICPTLRLVDPEGVTEPLSSEYGRCKTVTARFWPWLCGKSLSTV